MALVTKYAENIPVYWADTEDFIALARAYSTVLDRLFEDVASCFEAAINPATMARVELIELLEQLGYDDVRYYTTDELRALYVDIITTRRVMTEAAFAKHLQEACPSGKVVKVEVTDGTLNILPESPEQIVVYISVDRGGRTCASTECSADCPCGGDGGCGGDTSCGLVYVVAYASHLDYPRRDDDGNVLDWAFSYDSLARRIVDSFPAAVRLMLDAILQPIPLGVVYAAVPSLVVDCYADGKRGVKTKYIWGGMTDGETDMDIISSQAMSYTDLPATRASDYRPAIHVESTAGSETVEGFAEVGTARTSWSQLRGEAILRTGQRGLIYEKDIKGTALPSPPNEYVEAAGWDVVGTQAPTTPSSYTLSSTYTPAIHVESATGSETVEGFAEVGTARTSWSELRGEAILRTGQRGLIYEKDIKGTALPSPPNEYVEAAGWDVVGTQAPTAPSSHTLSSTYTPAIHVESTAGSETVEGFAEVGTARTSWSELRGEAILRTGQRGLLNGDGVVQFFTTSDLGDILSGADMTYFEVGQGFVEQYKEIGA